MCAAKTSDSLWWFFPALFIAAFGLNWLWEMLQVPAYEGMAGHPWREIALHCAGASLGDAAITLGIYGVGALAAGRLRWGMKPTWNVYVTAALLGGACAAAIEWQALLSQRWTYSDRMVLVPVLGVGLWPFLQLVLLVPLSFAIAAWWAGSVQQGELDSPPSS